MVTLKNTIINQSTEILRAPLKTHSTEGSKRLRCMKKIIAMFPKTKVCGRTKLDPTQEPTSMNSFCGQAKGAANKDFVDLTTVARPKQGSLKTRRQGVYHAQAHIMGSRSTIRHCSLGGSQTNKLFSTRDGSDYGTKTAVIHEAVSFAKPMTGSNRSLF